MVSVFDLEGPLIPKDLAFDASVLFVKKEGIDDFGLKVFARISNLDDILYFVLQMLWPNGDRYNSGDTLSLQAPLISAFGATSEGLREQARRSVEFIPGTREFVQRIQKKDNLYVVSTGLEQHVEPVTDFLGIPRDKVYCTKFPIDELSRNVSLADKYFVRDVLSQIIYNTPELEWKRGMTPEDLPARTKANLNLLRYYFFEYLPRTSYSELLKVRPVGGTRKRDALLEIAEKEGIPLSSVKVEGDGITEQEMLTAVRDNNGLAISFNGNEHAIPYANVAVISDHKVPTEIVFETFDTYGIKAVKEITSRWNPDTLKHAVRNNYFSGFLYDLLESTYPTELMKFPMAVWITPENITPTIKESETMRTAVRKYAGRLA